jgi:dihydropteroate synthase
MLWQTTRFRIDLSVPRVMGIVNVTPDSFYDGGIHGRTSAALAHCERLIAEGCDILDIGGESTRPGAKTVTPDEELCRLLPVLRGAVSLGVPVSVDTSEPQVMREALATGVDIVNDVRALKRPGAIAVLAEHGSAGVCLMHMRGEPDTMSALTDYADPVREVADFLRSRAEAVESAGIDRSRIVIDPGVGFAKTSDQNLCLLAFQHQFTRLAWPVLVGWSRKGTLGQVTGRPVHDRLAASVAAALIAVERGASIVRVHDVAETVDALKVWRAVGKAGGETMTRGVVVAQASDAGNSDCHREP